MNKQLIVVAYIIYIIYIFLFIRDICKCRKLFERIKERLNKRVILTTQEEWLNAKKTFNQVKKSGRKNRKRNRKVSM